jgi:hypothetical protein
MSENPGYTIRNSGESTWSGAVTSLAYTRSRPLTDLRSARLGDRDAAFRREQVRLDQGIQLPPQQQLPCSHLWLSLVAITGSMRRHSLCADQPCNFGVNNGSIEYLLR